MGSYFQLLGPSQDLSLAYASTYNFPLVGLSVLTAIFASLMAMQMAGRIQHSSNILWKLTWLTPGALAMGGGVWAMHFIGMLAFSLPCGISYDPAITILSMVPGIIASGVALWVIAHSHASVPLLAVGGVLMGLGIGTMHYTGMAAMRLDAFIYYAPDWFALSIVFAVVLAWLSLYMKFALNARASGFPSWAVSFLGAVLMGSAISGMHYIAMEAAFFIPVGESPATVPGVAPTTLAIGIGTISLLIVALALSASMVGRHIETIGILQTEIQERERAEAQIRTLSQAVQQSPATVVITDTDGAIEYVNPKFTKTTGYTFDEAIGRNPRMLKSGEKTAEDYAELWNTITSGNEWHGEFHNRRKDGSLYWETASISPIRALDGTITNFIAVKEDVTDRKAIEEALSEAHAKAELDAAQERVLERLLHLSLQDVSMENYLTQAIETLLQNVPWLTLLHEGAIFLTAQKGCGDHLDLIAGHRLNPALLTKCAQVPFNHCLCGRAARSREIVHADHVDDRHDIRFDGMSPHGHYAVPILQEDRSLGVLTLYVPHGYQRRDSDELFLKRVGEVLSIGISRRYDAEELTVAKVNAEKANQAKSDFLASMSHELRTPLNAILGFGQLLSFNPKEPLTQAQQDSINQIMKGGQHLLDLINDVLDLAKIEAGKVQLSIENISILKVLEECLPLTQSLAQTRNIELIVSEGFDHDHTIRADHIRFKQSLLNLMSNAVKYNRDNGTVTLTCRDMPNGMARLSVTDTGEGIAQDRFEELFHPFSRLDAENTEIEGTGIGLTITKQLIERMGGHIGLESEIGEGTTFWLDLPLAEVKVGDLARTAQVSEGSATTLPGVNGTVLYVEDNPANLKLMEMIVERVEGLTMISAHNAELGIELAKSERPGMIILDINLPGMDGYEAFEKLRSIPATKHIPVIALSANAMPQDIEKSLKMGFHSYLTKPVQVEKVVAVIKDILETVPVS